VFCGGLNPEVPLGVRGGSGFFWVRINFFLRGRFFWVFGVGFIGFSL
jgi:hypothetical protein